MLATLLVLDTETTGIDPARDSVIEIAARLVIVDPATGALQPGGELYHELQDPGRPLPTRIVEITGLTDADVRDRAIDWDRVRRLLVRADFIVAHNAEFDRGFVERHVRESRAKIWACSYRLMNWAGRGFPSARLTELCSAHGVSLQPHRAHHDVNALVELLSQTDREGKLYFVDLLTAAAAPSVRVEATGSPFEKKDLLKSRGYRWNGTVWWKYVPPTERDAETAWLAAQIYDGTFLGRTIDVSPAERFRPEPPIKEPGGETPPSS